MLSRWSSKSTRLEVLKDGKESGSAVAFSSSTHVQDDNSTMKYIIAGSVLATCVGNMFIMRSRPVNMGENTFHRRTYGGPWIDLSELPAY